MGELLPFPDSLTGRQVAAVLATMRAMPLPTVEEAVRQAAEDDAYFAAFEGDAPLNTPEWVE